MPLGSPSISTPNALDLRSIAMAVSNTRQRIEQLEAALSTAGSTTTAASTQNSAQLNAIRQQLVALQAQITALENTVVDDASLVISQRSFNPVIPVHERGVDDASNVLAQRTFSPVSIPPSVPGPPGTVIVDDASLVLAQRTFNPAPPAAASAPAPAASGTTILETQIFGG